MTTLQDKLQAATSSLLVDIYNELANKPVKRFATKSSGVSRILKLATDPVSTKLVESMLGEDDQPVEELEESIEEQIQQQEKIVADTKVPHITKETSKIKMNSSLAEYLKASGVDDVRYNKTEAAAKIGKSSIYLQPLVNTNTNEIKVYIMGANSRSKTFVELTKTLSAVFSAPDKLNETSAVWYMNRAHLATKLIMLQEQYELLAA